MNTKNKEQFEAEMTEFDWIQLRSDMDTITPKESRKEILLRKIKENPFVPIGVLATTVALCSGLWSFKNGKKKMSQYMMRTRIAAQGFTIIAMIVGMGLGASKISKINT